MKVERKHVLVNDRGEQLNGDHAHHIMQLIAALQKAPILCETTPVSAQAALRIVEALLDNSEIVLQVLSD